MIGRRILHVSDSLQIGGAERVLIGLAAGLVDRGARVTVACSVGGPLEVEAHRAGVDVRVLGSSLVKRRLDADFTCTLTRLIMNEPPDLVHTHMHASSVAATLALRQSRIPLVVHEHSEAGWRDSETRCAAAEAYRRMHCRGYRALRRPLVACLDRMGRWSESSPGCSQKRVLRSSSERRRCSRRAWPMWALS